MPVNNSVTLIGRITKEPELQSYGKGKDGGKYLHFSMAVRDGLNKDGDPNTQFIDCIAWNATAETIAQYVEKGDMLAISGKLVQNNYEDADGVKRYSMQVVANGLELLPNNRAEEKEEPKKNGKYHR